MKKNITTISVFRIIFAFAIFFLYENSKAQNLVPNGSFNIIDQNDCPERPRTNDKNVNLLPGWTWPTVDGTTDYFNTCSRGGMVGIPNNFAGRCPTKNGEGYVGLILKTKAEGKENYREYIQTRLTETLKKDHIYCVSVFYRLADCSTFSIDKLGIYFTQAETKIPSGKVMAGFKPQIETEGYFLDNNEEWKPLYTIYKATGNEQFMMIGNFKTDVDTQEKPRKQGAGCDERKDYAYYYIDSVQVIELKRNCEPCNCVAQDIKVTVKRDSCFNGGTNLTAMIEGGTRPYHRINWNDGEVKSARYEHALTGKHTVQVTDDWGCVAEKSIAFDCGFPLEAKVSDSGYEGGNTGFIKLVVKGGRKPYRFNWSNGSTTKDVSGLPYGSYTFTVIDAQGATYTDSLRFIVPLSVEHESNYPGGSEGYIRLSVSGGRPPYTFQWSTGETSQNLENLSHGEYVYTVKDADNRSAVDTVIFIQGLGAKIIKGYTDECDGYIELKPFGGIPPYTYSWEKGDSTQRLDSLCAGLYKFKVKDAENREFSGSVKFVEPIKVTVEKGFSFETDGFVNLKVRGGCPPYTYKWSNDSTVPGMKYLENGLYEFTVSGSCGKTYTDTVRIKGSIVLNNVLFKTGSATLLPSSYPELDRIVSYMSRKPNVKVEISGHTDDVGGEEYNKNLSERRAKSVVEYLVSKGIAQERLVYKGYGEERPIATNETDEGRKLNRRVEFNIIKE